ncbi:15723_t:CDS:2, partial [Funneliformis geosporum]
MTEAGKTGESSSQKYPFISNIKSEEVNSVYYRGSYYYYKKGWARGKLTILKAYLANKCLSYPEEISKYWCEKLIK